MADWRDELPDLAALDDQAAADAINAMVVEVRDSYRVTYRTVLAVTRSPTKTEAIAATIKAAMPTIDGMLRDYSDGGGIDVSFGDVRTFVSGLVGEGDSHLTQAEADAINALGVRTESKYGWIQGSQVANARGH